MGGLRYLFTFSPPSVRLAIASRFELSSPQFKSWLHALNIVRNVCAHHSRFFNRYYSITPMLPPKGALTDLDMIRGAKNTTFAMLTLLQHLGSCTFGYNASLLPSVVRSFPGHSGLKLGALGASESWEHSPLWQVGVPRP